MRSLHWRDSFTIQASVKACPQPEHAPLITVGYDATGNAQGKSQPSGGTGQGEDWTGKRK
jgi:hypothetical protein